MGSMFDLSAAVRLYLLSCFVVSVDFTLGLGQSQDTEFMFQLPAGRTECFYQTATKNGSLEVEYQVIAGAGLDVGFTLISPSGYKLASEFRTSDGIHTVEPTEDGDYRLCFDNSFSKLSEKMVFFEVIVEGQPGDAWGDEEWADMAEPESMVEYKLEDIRETMDSVHRHLERSRQLQTMLRAFEARDRYLLEDNLWRVSFWSSMSLLVILTVAVTQVYTLRRLFDDKTVCKP
ncbi:transmembrane emp24 domain-containing protein 1-like isoform X1 [Salvelinus namaycush]|uniref:Transmembrane emp24 domain-containing protein 1-like isoform X1 n=1 Tax=Salvelinus namaycush TaxID=8040 RepID=A0A8U0U708_SALNM|nr:transmembrane emp24 domain-containing protein 1-like isoform X1 [Salvelinus namaycush]